MKTTGARLLTFKQKSMAYVLPLWPLPVAVVLLAFPVIGFALCLGKWCFTFACHVSVFPQEGESRP